MEKGKIKTFSDLKAWQEAHKLTLSIYGVIRSFPKNESFGLSSQMKRSAISIESNIAEGFGRNTAKDKRQFYSISRGSLRELENQAIIEKDLGFISAAEYQTFFKQADITSRLLTGLTRSAENRRT